MKRSVLAAVLALGAWSVCAPPASAQVPGRVSFDAVVYAEDARRAGDIELFVILKNVHGLPRIAVAEAAWGNRFSLELLGDETRKANGRIYIDTEEDGIYIDDKENVVLTGTCEQFKAGRFTLEAKNGSFEVERFVPPTREWLSC